MIPDSIVRLSHVKLYNKFQFLRLPFYNEYTLGLYSEGNSSSQDLCMDREGLVHAGASHCMWK